MGAVLLGADIYKAFMHGPEHGIELFHGFTYSGHPVAAAAGLATLEVYREEGTFAQARELESMFAEELHQFDHYLKVIDVRDIGLMGTIELEPRKGSPGARGLEVHKQCFWEEDLVIRNNMDIFQFSPFLSSRPADLSHTFAAVKRVIDKVA